MCSQCAMLPTERIHDRSSFSSRSGGNRKVRYVANNDLESKVSGPTDWRYHPGRSLQHHFETPIGTSRLRCSIGPVCSLVACKQTLGGRLIASVCRVGDLRQCTPANSPPSESAICPKSKAEIFERWTSSAFRHFQQLRACASNFPQQIDTRLVFFSPACNRAYWHSVLFEVEKHHADSQEAEEEQRGSSCAVNPVPNKGHQRPSDSCRHRGGKRIRSIGKEALVEDDKEQEGDQGQGQERCSQARDMGCFGT